MKMVCVTTDSARLNNVTFLKRMNPVALLAKKGVIGWIGYMLLMKMMGMRILMTQTTLVKIYSNKMNVIQKIIQPLDLFEDDTHINSEVILSDDPSMPVTPGGSTG